MPLSRELSQCPPCHHTRLKDVMDQSYPIYACTCATRVRYSSVHVILCGSWMQSLFN